MDPMTSAPVIIYPSDGTGCGYYRLIWPGLAVAAAGKPVQVMNKPPQIVVDNHNPPQVRGINVGNYKIIILQRPGSYQIAQAIPLLQDKGVTVVIDMDDDLSNIHPRNPAWKQYDPRMNHKVNFMNAKRACELADWVTTTTPALAEYYGEHSRVTVIPNHIPKSYLTIPRPQNEVPIVTWTGWTTTHPDDLTVTGGMINQVLIDTGARFMAYGDTGIFTQLQVRMRPPHFHQSFTSIKDYPKTLAQADIGLVPLKQSVFNKSKSNLKAKEMLALGIVPVVSPTPDNMILVEMGVAIVAEKPRDWYDRVKELILDHEYREELSKRGREVAAGLTIEGNAMLWYNCWQNAYRQVNKITGVAELPMKRWV